jgi:hypothetical protein
VSTLRIDLDEATGDALTSLAAARGTTAADLVSQIVSQYVKIHDLPANGRQVVPGQGEADPLDAIVGSLDIDPVEDIDGVIYGR